MKVLLAFLIIGLSLPSLLVVFPAPLNVLWRLKIGSTELGYFLVFPVLILSFCIFHFYSGKWVATAGILAAVFYSLPLLKATILSFSVRSQLESAYGKVKYFEEKPLSYPQLFGLKNKPDIKYKTLTFNTISGKSLSLDLYSNSDKSRLKTCIISVHGGAWASGDNKMFVAFNKDIASKGYVVADVSYRLAPESIFPAQEQDILTAIDFLKAHSSEYQIDTNNIFLLGRSAGGQIAAVTAFHLTKLKIKGLICFYTPLDMVWGYSLPGNPLILDSRKVLVDYLGGTLEQAKESFIASSPVHQVTGNAPPILMIHGESDEMVAYGHNLRLIDRIKDKNIPYYLLSLPYATHGCDYFFNSQSAQLSTFAVDYFIKRYSTD